MLTHLLAQGDGITFFNELMSELAPVEGEMTLVIIVARLACAALIGWVLGLGYRMSYTGKKLKPTMHHTLVMLCMGGALVWLVVGNNIVRAFGLAGTSGLLRSRTTVSDPKDTTVLFFAMILGMAVGLGHYLTGIVGCLFVFCALILMRLTHTPEPPKVKAPPKPDPEVPGEIAAGTAPAIAPGLGPDLPPSA